jgi:hypothetical protein
MTTKPFKILTCVALAGALAATVPMPTSAQDRLPWLREAPQPTTEYDARSGTQRDSLPPPAPAYEPPPPRDDERQAGRTYDNRYDDRDQASRRSFDRVETYRPPAPVDRDDVYRPPQRYEPAPEPRSASRDDAYRPPQRGERYDAPRGSDEPRWVDRDERPDGYDRRHASNEPGPYRDRGGSHDDGTYSMREIIGAGHGFFGSISQGLASVIEYAFKTKGRPNGYILGEDVGGAFVAGLRYGQGRLYTRDAGTHKVYWQGPSIGYDAGAEGSKVMVLVYNLRDIGDLYERFGGVAGSAYVVGGVGLTFQQRDDVVLAPIRAGVGLRLGANVGYLKYTRRPTWNPF